MIDLFDKFSDFIFLIFSKTRRLASCSKDAKEICTIVNLKLYQSLQSLVIYRTIGLKWSNESYT